MSAAGGKDMRCPACRRRGLYVRAFFTYLITAGISVLLMQLQHSWHMLPQSAYISLLVACIGVELAGLAVVLFGMFERCTCR